MSLDTQQLTGGKDGGLHITDASNACRTLFYNLHKQDWCDELCEFFDMPREALPRIVSNSEVYGHFKKGHLLEGIPIAGLIGDQQAALVGNKCLTKGDAKQTYGAFVSSRFVLDLPRRHQLVGKRRVKLTPRTTLAGTGCFMLFNTGTDIVKSTHGLVTTVRLLAVLQVSRGRGSRRSPFRI